MDKTYYCHESTGRIQFDPLKKTRHYEPWWMLLICDEGIAKLYSWFALKWGVEIMPGSRWMTHISAIKGERPMDVKLWGNVRGKLKFYYSNQVRWDNGTHAWLDVYCPALSKLRVDLGLNAKDKYHLTIGRLKHEREYVPHRYENR